MQGRLTKPAVMYFPLYVVTSHLKHIILHCLSLSADFKHTYLWSATQWKIVICTIFLRFPPPSHTTAQTTIYQSSESFHIRGIWNTSHSSEVTLRDLEPGMVAVPVN